MLGLTKLAAGPGNVELTVRPERLPGSAEVAIEVHGAGICGTDLHIESGEYPSAPPVTMGHEVSGRVTEVGEGVDAGLVGKMVASETFYSTCGHCAACREGRPNLCGERRSIGTHVDGAFAARLVVPAINLHPIPDWLDAHAATLLEPLACVCQCLLDPVEVSPGDRVVVAGPGPMGLLSAEVARAMGGVVTVAGLPADEERLSVAADLGFEITARALAEPIADVSIEASGSAGGVAACLQATRPGGRFVQVGIVGAPVVVPYDLVLFREMSYRTGFASTPRSWRRALDLVECRATTLEPLISAVKPLEDWEQAFAALRRGEGMKIVLDPRG